MTQRESLVSIVLPVFNGERFISNAIESVLAQSYPHWELLIVDDGSNDNSAAICDAYSSKDSRIRVFHQSNGGVNSARAIGVDNAQGEFLTFLDADDVFIRDSLMVMTDSFSETVDVVCCGEEETFLDKEEYLMRLWKGQLLPGICTKMFKVPLFKQIDYYLERRLAMGEDLLINSMYALSINKAKVISSHIYIINNDNSLSVTKTFKHNWEYEKFFFCKVQEHFLDKCTEWDSYDKLKCLVNKSWLNAMKYVMLNGGRIDYNDSQFKEVKNYFNKRKSVLGPSEKLIFSLHNPHLYRLLIWVYQRTIKIIRKGL